jgi:hypothetical protein
MVFQSGCIAYIPTSSVWGSFFPTSSLTFVVGGVFDYSYSNRSEVELYYGFDLHFHMDRNDEHFFMCFFFFGYLEFFL